MFIHSSYLPSERAYSVIIEKGVNICNPGVYSLDFDGARPTWQHKLQISAV